MTSIPTGGADGRWAWSPRATVARVTLRWAMRQPASWLAALVAIAASLVLQDAPAPVTGPLAAAVGGLTACAAVGATAGGAWVAARAAVPAAAITLGAAVAGAVPVGVALLAGLATATVVVGRLRATAAAADAVTTALVVTGVVGALATGATALAATPRAGHATVLGAAAIAVAVAAAPARRSADRVGGSFDPLPWSRGRPPGPCPAPTRLRSALLTAAMVSGLATMVGGVFLVPSPFVAALSGSAWLVALAAPPACLGAVAASDAAIRRSTLVGPATAVRTVAWHAAVVGWPMCVALALAAGDGARQGAAAWALATVSGLAIAIAGAAVWGRWGEDDAGGASRAETAQAVALGGVALALIFGCRLAG